MKIAILNIYNGVVERGSEVFVNELASHLNGSNEITLFQTGKSLNIRYKVRQISGIPLYPNQSAGGIRGKLSEQYYHFLVFLFTLKCFLFLLKEKFDWIIPVNGSSQALICRIIRFINGSKILISGHAGIGLDDRLNLLIGRPDIFVALSPEAKIWAEKIRGKSRIVYIPDGISEHFSNENILPAKLNLRNPVILCVSALVPYKRVDLLIRAVSKIPHVSLLVIGSGPLYKYIVQLGNSLLPGRFQLIDYVKHREIGSYYRACQLFSLPSEKTEAFGLVYLEALASGLPVVAPDDLNRRTILGDAGLYADVQNIDEYADVLKNGLMISGGRKQKKQAEKYSWDKIVGQYQGVMSSYD